MFYGLSFYCRHRDWKCGRKFPEICVQQAKWPIIVCTAQFYCCNVRLRLVRSNVRKPYCCRGAVVASSLLFWCQGTVIYLGIEHRAGGSIAPWKCQFNKAWKPQPQLQLSFSGVLNWESHLWCRSARHLIVWRAGIYVIRINCATIRHSQYVWHIASPFSTTASSALYPVGKDT